MIFVVFRAQFRFSPVLKDGVSQNLAFGKRSPRDAHFFIASFLRMKSPSNLFFESKSNEIKFDGHSVFKMLLLLQKSEHLGGTHMKDEIGITF
jgi:hypothetical protein